MRIELISAASLVICSTTAIGVAGDTPNETKAHIAHLVGSDPCSISEENADSPYAQTEIDGTWQLVEWNENGRLDERVVADDYRIVRINGVQSIARGGMPFSASWFRVRHDGDKWIEFWDEKSSKWAGFTRYRIDKDTLKVAQYIDEKRSGKEFPKDLKPREGVIIVTYRRIRPLETDSAAVSSPEPK